MLDKSSRGSCHEDILGLAYDQHLSTLAVQLNLFFFSIPSLPKTVGVLKPEFSGQALLLDSSVAS